MLSLRYVRNTLPGKVGVGCKVSKVMCWFTSCFAGSKEGRSGDVLPPPTKKQTQHQYTVRENETARGRVGGGEITTCNKSAL